MNLTGNFMRDQFSNMWRDFAWKQGESNKWICLIIEAGYKSWGSIVDLLNLFRTNVVEYLTNMQHIGYLWWLTISTFCWVLYSTLLLLWQHYVCRHTQTLRWAVQTIWCLGCGLDDWGILFNSWKGQKISLVHSVWTGFWAHPTS